MPTVPPHTMPPVPPHPLHPLHPLPPAFDHADSDPASSVASPSGASSCSYGSSLLPPRFEDFLAAGPSGAEVFVDKLEGLVEETQLARILEAQRHMLTRFEKTNEMLLNFNALSATRYENAAVDYRRHTALLLDMKRELDSVFRRIRSLKSRLAKVYPEAFEVCSDVYNMDELLEEDEGEERGRRSAHALGPPKPDADSLSAPDHHRRRSRSFPNSSLSSTLSAASHLSHDVPSLCQPIAAVQIDSDGFDSDQFEEVNVRSRQPVPEGQSPNSELRTSGSSDEFGKSARETVKRQNANENKVKENRWSSDGSNRQKNETKLRSTRQVMSHEERPCSSVYFDMNSANCEKDSRFEYAKENEGQKKKSERERLKKSESIGASVYVERGKEENRKSGICAIIEEDNKLTEDKQTHPNPPSQTHSNPPSQTHPNPPSQTHPNPPSQTYPNPPSQTHPNPPCQTHPPNQKQQLQKQPPQQPKLPLSSQPHAPTSTRPKSGSKLKSAPKEDHPQKDEADIPYDVTLSKMASETHRFISEGVAAAVDAVLTHTSTVTTAATTTPPPPKEGRKVRAGYGVYQPPRKRTSSGEGSGE